MLRGVDWGFTHCFAVVVGFVVGRRLYIIDAFEIPELEPHQCVEVCDRNAIVSRRVPLRSSTARPPTATTSSVRCC